MSNQHESDSRQLPIPIDWFAPRDLGSKIPMRAEDVRIWASVGPAFTNEQLHELLSMRQLACIRINIAKFAHSQDLIAMIQVIDAARAQWGSLIKLCLDTAGPKIRVRGLRNIYGATQVAVYQGEDVIIAGRGDLPALAHFENIKVIPTDATLPVAPADAENGVVFISDGWAQFRIVEAIPGGARCKALHNTVVYEARGVNLLGMYDSALCLTPADMSMLGAIAQSDCRVDFVGLSFTNTAADIQDCRRFLVVSGLQAGIVAKIETRAALANLTAIAMESDAVMIARGDLAVEVAPTGVDMLQVEDSIRDACAQVMKECIIGTRVADSLADGRESLDDCEKNRLSYELRRGLPLTIMLANETIEGDNACRNYNIVMDALQEATG